MSDIKKLKDLNVYFRWIPASELKVDREVYQRRVKPKLVRRIIANFNPRALGTLTIGERSTGLRKRPFDYYIEDGQQRWTAVMELDPDYELACLVFGSSVAAIEANDFVTVNHNRQSLNAWELFRARLGSDDRSAPSIKQIIEHYDLTLRLGPGGLGEREIACSSVLDDLYSKGKLTDVLDIITQAWGVHHREALTGHFMRALLTLLLHYPKIDKRELIATLRAYDPGMLISSANQLTLIHKRHKLERIFVEYYNRHIPGKGARLRSWEEQAKELREAQWFNEHTSQTVTFSGFFPPRLRQEDAS